jgi:uncharacterized protein (TIGR00725 family)
MRVSVIGGSTADTELGERARTLGQILASRGHVVVCGGRGGVMAAVCRGARDHGGRTIGLLPGSDPGAANDHVTVPIATGMGNARNALVVGNGDGVIALDGAYGTLSEIALALDAGLPIAGIDTHDVDGVEAVRSPMAAVEYVEDASDQQ